MAVRRPAFLSESGLTPAERGTALHTFMQFARYDAAADSPEGERNRLVREGFLTVQQGEALPFAKIRAFFGGSLYRRMEGASRLWREVPFTVAVSPHLLTDEAEELEGESVIVQGIADCVFEEDGQLVIVDYKTDRVKTGEELVGRYRDQLGIYAYALAQTLAFRSGNACCIPLPCPGQCRFPRPPLKGMAGCRGVTYTVNRRESIP